MPSDARTFASTGVLSPFSLAIVSSNLLPRVRACACVNCAFSAKYPICNEDITQNYRVYLENASVRAPREKKRRRASKGEREGERDTSKYKSA